MDSTQLIRKKKIIHLITLIFLMMFHFSHLVIHDMSYEGYWNLSNQGSHVIHSIIALGLTITSGFFLRYFIKNKWMFFGYVLLLIICIVFQLLATNISFNTDVYSYKHMMLQIAIAISIFIFCSILVIMIKDVFVEKHDLSYAILGAANIFFSLIITFAFLFTLLTLTYPTMLPDARLATEFYNASFIISSYTVAGVDFPTKLPLIITNIAAFESILLQLYAVIIIGRLLTR